MRLSFLLRWFCVAAALLGGLAEAADCANPRKATGLISEPFFRGIENATDLIAKQKYNEAIERLGKIAESGNDYEKAVAFYNLGFAYSSKNDLTGAGKAFQSALNLNALPQQQHEQLQYNLGQIYVANGQFDEGIRTLEQFMSEACIPIPAEAHIFLANALSEKKRFREALPQIDLALSKSKQVKETWLQLKLALNYELKDYPACAQTLVQLIGLVPDKADYWKQLSSMFFEMKKDTESLAVLALAERQGFIEKPAEVKNLFNVYMLLELPFKAGMLMQESIDKGKVPADEKNLDSLAGAWINARESARAETVLKKLAASSGKGEYDYRLGGIYGDDERWKESREMMKQALAKGGFDRQGEAWMRVAVASYNLGERKEAVAALQKAAGFDETRKQAAEWLRHLQSEGETAAASAPG
ncbi:MAG: tetratricopeptide repeat protein [Panacagrimonas sp.]